MLTEAIFTCRGKELESGDSKLYNQAKLIAWMSKNLPSLVQLAKIGKHRESYQKSVINAAALSDMYHTSGNGNPISITNQNVKNPLETLDSRDIDLTKNMK